MASKTIVANLTHPQRVRLLYKTCLKLHRGLPDQMQIIGDAYVKEEFKRHKSATPEQTAAFMEAWAKYAVTISKQISVKGLQKSAVIGQGLEEKDLEGFSGEQIAQLYELYQETSKPSEYPS